MSSAATKETEQQLKSQNTDSETNDMAITINQNENEKQNIIPKNSPTETNDDGPTTELAGTVSVAIPIDNEDEENEYIAKKKEVKQYEYTGRSHRHPGPKSSNLPKPPTAPPPSKPLKCLCFNLQHIQTNFEGNNPIICNRLFLCGTDISTYIGTLLLMNVPGFFFYWAIFAYLPQHGMAFFIICLSLSFIWFAVYFFTLPTNTH